MSQQSRYSDKVQAHKENKQSTGNPGRLQVDHLLLEIGLLRTETEKMTACRFAGFFAAAKLYDLDADRTIDRSVGAPGDLALQRCVTDDRSEPASVLPERVDDDGSCVLQHCHSTQRSLLCWRTERDR